jgi:hypothetical protein
MHAAVSGGVVSMLQHCDPSPLAPVVLPFPCSQDLAAALKLVYEKCGDEFAAHLLQVAAPAAGLPSQLAQQLVFTIQRSEAKDVRDALRSLLMQSQGIAVVAK